MIEPVSYSVKDAASALGIGKTMLYQLINAGIIPTFKIGTRTLIRRADLDEFTRERAEAA